MNFKDYLRSKKYSLLLILLGITVLIITIKYDRWELLYVPWAYTKFFDLHAIFAASDCHQQGYNVFLENPCDVANRAHFYSRIWLWIGKLGLTRENNNVAGMLVIGIFLLVSVKILEPENIKQFMLSAIVLFSPPVMLGVERANNDLIIFVILALAIYCLEKRKSTLSNIVSYTLLVFASFLKFYPIISFSLYAKQIKNQKKFWLLMFLTLLIMLIYVLLTYEDLKVLLQTIPRPTSRYSFGANLLFLSIGLDSKLKIFTLIAGSLVVLLAFKLSSYLNISELDADLKNTTFFTIGSLNLLFCFFMNTNYYYRCVYFIFTLPYLFEFLNNKTLSSFTRRTIHLFFIVLILYLWQEVGFTLESPVNEWWSISEPPSQNFLRLLLILEQLFAWTLMTILLGILLNLIKQSIRDKIFIPLARFKI